jgi:hypothetical protein
MYDNLCTIVMSDTKILILHMNPTNKNLIASNYNSNQVAIEWRLLDKNIMTLAIAITKKETQRITTL